MANSSKNNRIWIPVAIVLAALLIARLAILLSRTVLSREGNPAPEATTALSTEASSTDTVSYFSNLSGSGSGTAAEDSASDTSTVTAEDNEDELTYLQAVAKSYSYTALLTKADKLDGKVVTFSGPITSIRNQGYRIALENNTDEIVNAERIYKTVVRTEDELSEGDTVTVYGLVSGTVSQPSIVAGSELTYPNIQALYIIEDS